MEEVRATGTYKEFKETLDRDFRQAAESFVHIGYMLKIARDTEILRDSGYKTVAEFAKAEYGLGPDETSRFMAINDRYSEGGYSERLQERYSQYGQTKLAEMLTLPQEIVDSLDPRMTRDDIRGVKKELAEEKKTTDIEILLEGQKEEQRNMTMAQKVMEEHFHSHRDTFVGVASALAGQQAAEKVMDVLAPSGIAVIMERVQGVGRVMVSIRGLDTEIDVQNVRTMEKESVTWDRFLQEIQLIYPTAGLEPPKVTWERHYQEPFEEKQEEKKPEVAPAQKNPEAKRSTEQKKEKPKEKDHGTEKPAGDHERAGDDQEPEETQEPGTEDQETGTESGETGTESEETGTEENTEQIPGQDNIMNHPEYLPAGMTAAKVDGEPVRAEVELTESQRKEECISLIAIIQGNIGIENYAAAAKYTKTLLEHLEALT